MNAYQKILSSDSGPAVKEAAHELHCALLWSAALREALGDGRQVMLVELDTQRENAA